jgi:hypothetical protein
MTTGKTWQDLYKHALLETDWSKVDERILAAESAMTARLYEFSRIGGTLKENDAITNALQALRVLRKDSTTWHESQSKIGKILPSAVPSQKIVAMENVRLPAAS